MADAVGVVSVARLRPDDARALAATGDDAMQRGMGLDQPLTTGQWRQIIEQAQRGYAGQETWLYFAIRRDGRCVGWIGIRPIDDGRGRLCLGVGPAYRRQGIASRAVALIVRHAFEDLKWYQLECDVLAENVATVRLFESLASLGFESAPAGFHRSVSGKPVRTFSLSRSRWTSDAWRLAFFGKAGVPA